MTTKDVVKVFNAKRISNRKWRAVCPIHGGRYSGPLSIAQGHSGVIIKCFGGCDTRDVLAAKGLTFSDLFEGKPTPAIRARLSLQDRWEGLERQLGLAMWLEVMERPAYWRAAQRRIGDELRRLRCRTEPLRVIREQRGEQWQGMNQRQKNAVLEGIWHDLQNTNGQTQRLKP